MTSWGAAAKVQRFWGPQPPKVQGAGERSRTGCEGSSIGAVLPWSIRRFWVQCPLGSLDYSGNLVLGTLFCIVTELVWTAPLNARSCAEYIFAAVWNTALFCPKE